MIKSPYILPGLSYNPTDIIKDVCSFYKISIDPIVGGKEDVLGFKRRDYVTPRQVSMFFIRKYFPTLKSLYVASLFNRKAHATVLHAIKTIEGLKETDEKFSKEIQEINDIIKSRISNDKVHLH